MLSMTVKHATRKFVANALKKKEEERVGKAIFNSFSLPLHDPQLRRSTWEYKAAVHAAQ